PEKSWEGFEAYVLSRLPQLERLDGKEVTHAARIRARQKLPHLVEDLRVLAEEVRKGPPVDEGGLCGC
ncbi:unnamed protein product, partial [Discosporangium mesarthrocarpum]